MNGFLSTTSKNIILSRLYDEGISNGKISEYINNYFVTVDYDSFEELFQAVISDAKRIFEEV